MAAPTRRGTAQVCYTGRVTPLASLGWGIMDADTQRQAETFAIVCPLKDIDDADMLAFVATLIQDHDHLREKLLTEPDRRKRADKLVAMRPHLSFHAMSEEDYYVAELARSCGHQPIYDDQAKAEEARIWMPPSR